MSSFFRTAVAAGMLLIASRPQLADAQNASDSLGQNVSAITDPLLYVNPLIGASNGGNVFPGATLPYGMAKAVADTNGSSNQGGFAMDPDSWVTGFSAMHDSGTGGSPSLGLFPLFGYAGCDGGDVNRCAFPKKTRALFGRFDQANVSASPGYFGIRLNSGLKVDMTTTARTALFRFDFPKTAADGNPAQPLLFQDLSDLQDSRQDNATVTVDPGTGRITGSGRFSPSFGLGTFVAYFCTDFKGAERLDQGVYVNSRASTDVKTLTVSRGINGYPLPGGAFVRFKSADSQILARTAVSFISVDRACRTAETEIPDFNFAAVRNAASDAWRAKLSVVKVDATGADQSLVTNLFSGIYRTMINPQNYTGENPLWGGDGSAEPYFDSFYCLWDGFRSQLPFLTIVDPGAVAQMVRSLIDTYRHLGWLPDCRMSLCKGYTQGGSNADNVLADAYVKGITSGIDWTTGYEAVVKDATVEPYDWAVNGRGGLDSWVRLGYIPVQDFDYKGFGTMTRSVSRTLEYSYNDFVISQISGGLKKTADQEKFRRSSGNWANLFRDDQTSSFINGTDTGFKGFFQPRNLNDTWSRQDPIQCSNLGLPFSCSLQVTGAETFESSLWEYGFFVPHDQAALISLYGGPAEYTRRLDYLHDQNITYIGNEPSFLTVFQYHYAGRPGLSTKRAHFYIPRYFGATPDGLPGNDDGGAMGSFVAMAMLGMFPNAGQDVYLISAPFLREVSIANPVTGKTATVRALAFDGPAYKNIYIQRATLDGKDYTRNWIGHSFFRDGGVLELTLGPSESSWGTRVEDLPPSLSPYKGFGTGSNGTENVARAVVRADEDLGQAGVYKRKFFGGLENTLGGGRKY